jgi:ADP-ribose pyrophosphatase
VQETVLECPSGGLDGEEPEIAARRELEEETGWVADTLTPLGSFFGSIGISNERFHLFLAKGLSETGTMNREPTEQIELITLPLQEAAELAFSGGIQDGPSALALILANQKLQPPSADCDRAQAGARRARESCAREASERGPRYAFNRSLFRS